MSDRDATLARARRLATIDLPAALALVEGLLAEAPDDVEALRAKADVLTEVGDEAGARACLERLLALDGGDARAWIDLGDLARDDARALDCYERAIAALRARGAAGEDLEAAHRGRDAVRGRIRS